jgi:two-component system, chemotaxis family, sensor kinase CheA
MALDRDAFIENFLDELRENIDQVDSKILVLKKDPKNEEELNTLLRALHTIKGSSRMLKFNTVESVAHGLENVFKGVKENRYPISKPLIQLVFITTDYLREGITRISETKSDEMEISKLLKVFEQVYENEPYSLDGLRKENPPADESPAPAADGGEDGETTAVVLPEGEISVREPMGVASAERPTRVTEQETIRIKISKVDKIIKSLNNLIIRQFQFKKQNDVLTELEQNFRELITLQAGGSDGAAFERKSSDCLKAIGQIRKSFSEELPLLERDTFEVQEEILSLRMLPLELILGSLGKMVEETAIQVGKEIDFELNGADIMIDKMILEKINDPIIHLVRNAVDHGIETPDVREQLGKPKAGKIQVRCSYESGSIIIRIQDDGKGIDYEKLRQKAIDMNPQQAEEIESMDHGSLNTFLFQSGFSTKESISELSGRGVGLDIVRYNIEKIKGKITLNSEKGNGTEFILSLPLSLATVEGFFVSCCDEKFLIPANFVKEILIIREDDQLDLLDRKAIRLRDKIIPIYYLANILDKEPEYPPEKYFVMVVESLGEMIGIVIDAIIQYSSLVYKPLPMNLNSMKIIQGIVFDESFNIVNILYVPELANRFKRIKNIDARKRFSTDQREYKHVLVVDDSLSTREIEKSILEIEQYNVATAVDGIDGLEKAREQYYHLIITDIQMPRMDGYTFVENLRKEDRYKSTPIIVVSSVNDPEVQTKFRSIGANSFIVKSEFDRGNLLAEVKELIG